MKTPIRWVLERRTEIVSIWVELLPQIFIGLLNAFFNWWLLFIASGASVILAIARAYFVEETVDIDSFFYPNFLWSMKWVTIFIFVYQVSATIAERLKFLRIRASKYELKDVDIDIHEFNIESPHEYAIKIKNNKPFALEHISVEVAHIQEGKEVQKLPSQVPHTLPWINGKDYHWGNYLVSEQGSLDSERYVALFSTINDKDFDFSYYIPVWESTPNDRKSFYSPNNTDSLVIIELQVKCKIEHHDVKPRTLKFSVKNIGKKVVIKKIGDSEK